MSEKKVLVVEDDRNIRHLIRTRLEIAGYQVITAGDGREALERFEAGKPDAMVLDINMPVLDGFGVLQALRDLGRSLPILVLTARHATEDVQRAVRLGAKDYLAKPFSEAQLLTRVGRLLRPKLVGSTQIELCD